MRVRSNLRALRGPRSIREVAGLTGLAVGEVSLLERGHLLPRADQLAAMEAAYGDPAAWYPPSVVRLAAHDIRVCPGCGEELPPEARANRLYHSDACRGRARKENDGT